MSVNKSRGIIILLPILAFVLSLIIKNEIISLLLVSICFLGTLVFLYRHLNELTDISRDNPKMKVLQSVTIFNAILTLAVILIVILMITGTIALDENQEAYIACIIVEVIILFLGNFAPKLPFNRHTGLRLPWTVTDEDTWIVAHRILGYISFPIALCNIIGVLSTHGNYAKCVVSMCALILWVAIPTVFSGIFYWKKMRGKL